jgi:hypothetical protein
VQPRKRPFRRHINGEFLRGPIPLHWLSLACKLPGKVVATALAIWFQAGRQGHEEGIKLTSQILDRFHVDRHAKFRALKELEKAGLIRVHRQAGKNPIVDLLEIDRDAA